MYISDISKTGSSWPKKPEPETITTPEPETITEPLPEAVTETVPVPEAATETAPEAIAESAPAPKAITETAPAPASMAETVEATASEPFVAAENIPAEQVLSTEAVPPAIDAAEQIETKTEAPEPAAQEPQVEYATLAAQEPAFENAMPAKQDSTFEYVKPTEQSSTFEYSKPAEAEQNPKQSRRIPLRIARNYFIVAAICAAVGFIYELFSHQVWSIYMIGAFAVPLVLGVIPNLIIAIGKLKTPGLAAENLYACGVATLTLGSLLKGVLQIYGTTNDLLEYYWLVGAGFAGLGLIFYIAQKKAVKRMA